MRVSFETKEAVKKLIRKISFTHSAKIVVASTGRAGSTMLTDSIASSLVEDQFGQFPPKAKRWIKLAAVEYLERIEEISSSSAPVLKTHDLYRPKLSDAAKFIFVFGDPLESAQSVAEMGKMHGDDWIRRHIYHLVGEGAVEDLFYRDVLNYEEQLNSWKAGNGIFLVHYEDLWDKKTELEMFLGFKIFLPKRRARALKSFPSEYNKQLFDHLKSLETRLRSSLTCSGGVV